MPATFANVQVYTGDRTPEAARAAVVDALCRVVGADGFVEATRPGERVDRTILVGPPGPGPWVAVYDEAGVPFPHLARALSAELGAALSVAINHSASLDLRLWLAGREADRYIRRVGTDAHWRHASPHIGRPELWADLLPADTGPDELHRAFALRPAQVERVLWAVVELLGLHPLHCCAGYRYFLERPEQAAALTRLPLRAVPDPAYLATVEGPPRLGWAVRRAKRRPPAQRRVGLGVSFSLSLEVRSAGGPGRGLEVVVSGEALARGLVEVGHADIARAWPHGKGESWDGRFEVIRAPAGGTPYRARFPDVELRAGLAVPDFWRHLPRDLPSGPPAEANGVRQFTVSVRATALALGSGDVRLAVAPLDNPRAGQATVTVLVEVAAPGARPRGVQ